MIVIDKEFEALIPPLSQDEYAGLESGILSDGCMMPLVLWNNILIDGHNRYRICEKHGIAYKTIQKGFENRDDVCDWIDANQLGRRNLTPDQMSLIRGRRYNRMKRQDGGHGNQKSGDQIDTPKTADILAKQHGVSAATIKRDGAAAALLEKHPEKAEAIIRGEIKKTDVIREIKRAEIIEDLEDILNVETKKTEGVYDVIVLDPPWPMQKIERDERPNQAELDYPTMTEGEIEEIEIPCANSCHVFVWTTHKFLPMAIRLIEKWEMKYVLTMVWHKPGGFQPIGLPQYNCEFILYARKGTPSFIDTKAFPVCFNAPRGAHSEKPEEFYELLRRVTAGRRLDMFNRREIKGFDAWGNES